MNILDRFKRKPKEIAYPESSDKVRLYSPDANDEGDTVIEDNIDTLPRRAPTTDFMVDQVRDKFNSAMNLASVHAELGSVQHLLALTFSDEDLKSYIASNKDAADVLLYCNCRFTNQPIPPEIHYIGERINKIIKTYWDQLAGKNVGGVRKMIRFHLMRFKIAWPMLDLFLSQNNELLLGRLQSAVKIINEKEEDYITLKKADFLLQELGLFIQNHCSMDSYLFYDKSREADWSSSTKFALNYLSSEVPLDKFRMNQLGKLIEETSLPPDMESIISKAYQFAANVEDETLSYGLSILQAKTKNLTTPVRETLRDRFTQRNMEYWDMLTERVIQINNQPNITL